MEKFLKAWEQCRSKNQTCSNCRYYDCGYCDYYGQKMPHNDSCTNWA